MVSSSVPTTVPATSASDKHRCLVLRQSNVPKRTRPGTSVSVVAEAVSSCGIYPIYCAVDQAPGQNLHLRSRAGRGSSRWSRRQALCREQRYRVYYFFKFCVEVQGSGVLSVPSRSPCHRQVSSRLDVASLPSVPGGIPSLEIVVDDDSAVALGHCPLEQDFMLAVGDGGQHRHVRVPWPVLVLLLVVSTSRLRLSR